LWGLWGPWALSVPLAPLERREARVWQDRREHEDQRALLDRRALEAVMDHEDQMDYREAQVQMVNKELQDLSEM
jgi:glycine/D-amino acid oxidase-like deaminating enzyme